MVSRGCFQVRPFSSKSSQDLKGLQLGRRVRALFTQLAHCREKENKC